MKKTIVQQSAGGVVFKNESGKIYILIAKHSMHHGWVFPKGLIGDNIKNEGKEETAIREVEEETGVVGKILQPLKPETFWFNFKGVKHKKTVFYYIMQCVSEDFSKHDTEMEEVEWIPAQEVEKRLTYQSDKKIFLEAKKIMDW